MSVLSALLAAAQDREEPAIRRAARRAGLLWRCQCGDDSPPERRYCEACGSRMVDVCTTGAPDPTSYVRSTGELCPERNPDRFHCTRSAGHTGEQHVAGNGTVVVAVWEWRDARQIETPLGRATLTVISAALDIELSPAEPGRCGAIRGDQALVRSRTHNPWVADCYQIFERGSGSPNWRPVTGELTAGQLPDWESFRKPATSTMSAHFDAWLSTTARNVHGQQEGAL